MGSGNEKWTLVTRYSGVTARDLHPFPYSPLAMAKGTLSYSLQDIVVVITTSCS